MKVIAHGLDYLRYRTFSDEDVLFIARRLSYVEIAERRYHGSRFVDLTGDAVELIRMFEDVELVAAMLAEILPVTRIDAFVDVEGRHVTKALGDGTSIWNGGVLETVYSHNLSARGNVPVFGRCYDARRAKHYDGIEVTRYELEFKRAMATKMLSVDGWCASPIAVALPYISRFFNAHILIEDMEAIELDAPTRRLEHSRERFYKRYGKSIMRDIQDMGIERLYHFIQECTTKGSLGNDNRRL